MPPCCHAMSSPHVVVPCHPLSVIVVTIVLVMIVVVTHIDRIEIVIVIGRRIVGGTHAIDHDDPVDPDPDHDRDRENEDGTRHATRRVHATTCRWRCRRHDVLWMSLCAHVMHTSLSSVCCSDDRDRGHRSDRDGKDRDRDRSDRDRPRAKELTPEEKAKQEAERKAKAEADEAEQR